jgi:sugar phosphate isomerase/epimerase
MKLSCLPVSYFDQIIKGRMSVGDWAREAASLGLDAIDLSILFLQGQGSGELRALRREIESCGLRVAMVTTYPDFTHPIPEARARETGKLERDLASALEVGAQMVRITAGQSHPETGETEGLAWAVEGLTAALPLAQQYGIQLVFENHSKPGVWDYADFAMPTEIFLSIVRATNGTALGINFDTANTLVAGDDPLPVLAQVMDRLVSIHAADTMARGALRPTVIGTGMVPFAEIFDLLHKHDFDGWICIEEASGTGRAGVESAVAFVRQAWSDAGARLAHS